ncbi:hypothetical protein RB195_025111 [Necator americanus]|uniref:Kinesin motor domain protein n=1 Tax=Necator americanus TaxID=51031 RepID=A0ABR1EQZ9_NECAM
MQILQEGNMRRTQESTKANRTSSRSHALLQEDKNPRKPFALLEQYGGKMKRCSPVLNTASGVAVGEATLPIWRDHFKTLLNRQAPSAPELEHVHRPTYAVNEEPPTCRRIREMTKIIRLIWIDERIPDSWIHAVIIPLHKKLSVMDSRISLLRVMYKSLDSHLDLAGDQFEAQAFGKGVGCRMGLSASLFNTLLVDAAVLQCTSQVVVVVPHSCCAASYSLHIGIAGVDGVAFGTDGAAITDACFLQCNKKCMEILQFHVSLENCTCQTIAFRRTTEPFRSN